MLLILRPARPIKKPGLEPGFLIGGKKVPRI